MKAFDVVLVPFPFADLSSMKKRPCVVLSSFRPRSLSEFLVLAMMTSQVKVPRFPFDVELKSYKSAGLPKATLVRLSKIVTLESGLVVKKIGSLSAIDQEALKKEFGKLFKGFL